MEKKKFGLWVQTKNLNLIDFQNIRIRAEVANKSFFLQEFYFVSSYKLYNAAAKLFSPAEISALNVWELKIYNF